MGRVFSRIRAARRWLPESKIDAIRNDRRTPATSRSCFATTRMPASRPSSRSTTPCSAPRSAACACGRTRAKQEALNDVLRLSRGMTYKNAVAGLNLGGGKAVIIGDPAKDKSEALFRAFGRFVNSLNGRYITAEDVGIDVNDMEHVFRETEFVTGVHQVHGGSGDPSPFTAYGTLQGLMAALNAQVRQRGRRQVQLRRAGRRPRRHASSSSCCANRAPRCSSPTSTRNWCSARSTNTAARRSASTRSTTSTPTSTARARSAARSTSRRCRA